MSGPARCPHCGAFDGQCCRDNRIRREDNMHLHQRIDGYEKKLAAERKKSHDLRRRIRLVTKDLRYGMPSRAQTVRVLTRLNPRSRLPLWLAKWVGP